MGWQRRVGDIGKASLGYGACQNVIGHLKRQQRQASKTDMHNARRRSPQSRNGRAACLALFFQVMFQCNRSSKGVQEAAAPRSARTTSLIRGRPWHEQRVPVAQTEQGRYVRTYHEAPEPSVGRRLRSTAATAPPAPQTAAGATHLDHAHRSRGSHRLDT